MISRIAVLCIALTFIAACKKQTNNTVTDPRAFILEMAKADLDRCTFKDEAYCVDGDMEAVLDKILIRKKMPTKERKLRRIATKLIMRTRTNATADPALRAELEAKIDTRFRNPKSYFDEKNKIVFADFGHLPGKFVKHRQSINKLSSHERYLDVMTPKGLALAEAFDIAKKIDPSWNRLAITFKTDGPVSGDTWEFIYTKNAEIVMIKGGDIYISEPIPADFSKLRVSEAWWDNKISCNGEQRPAKCIGRSVPKGSFDKLKKL